MMNRTHAADPPGETPAGTALATAVVLRRAQLGLTQVDLAKRAGIALRTVQNIEAGRTPHLRVLGAVARALGTDLAALWDMARRDRMEAAS